MNDFSLYTVRRNTALLLAFGAAPALAVAQSNVQLYGIIDAGVRRFPNLAQGTDKILGIDDGLRNRFGFRMTENLGGGTTAFIRLESSFRLDTGALRDPNKFWDDKAWVGLTNTRLGTVMLGRLRTPIDDMVSGTRFEAFGGYSLASSLSRTGRASDAWDSAIYYTSPRRDGFRAGAGMKMGEGTVKDSWGTHIEYTMGRVDLVAAYQVDGETLTSSRRSWNVSATYDAGFAKIFSTFVRTGDIGPGDAGHGQTATLGVQIPVRIGELRASLRASPASYLNGSDDRSGDIETTHIGIGYHYPLSKSTSINASLVQQTRKTYEKAGAVLSDRKGMGYDIGLRHYF